MDRDEDKERIEDMVGPKESGRQGMLEKKKVQREGDRAFREAKDDSFAEIDDSTLMGGGDSFQARYVIATPFTHIILIASSALHSVTPRGREWKKSEPRYKARNDNVSTI